MARNKAVQEPNLDHIIEPLRKFAVLISDINVDPHNARKHNERNIDSIKSSLKRFGQRLPLIVQKQGMIVRVGNGRILAAIALGWRHVAAFVVDENDVEAVAYAITDNRTAELADWDWSILTEKISELQAVDFPIGDFGWAQDEIDKLLDSSNKEITQDDPGTIHTGKAKSKSGKVYELGPHRLVCGDCLRPELWEILLRDERADMLLTDPPYGVSYSDKNTFLNANDGGKRNQVPIDNDAKSMEEMKVFWTDAFSMAFVYSKVGATYYITSPPGDGFLPLLLSIKDTGWLLKHNLVWVKNNHVLGRCDFNYKHEAIVYGWKPGAGHYFDAGPGDCFSVWEFDKPVSSKEHPTMKPVALFAKAIKHGCPRGGLVIDPFAGSGTTIIVCAEVGRVARCIEIDPHYCDLIRRRWTKYAIEHDIEVGSGKLS